MEAFLARHVSKAHDPHWRYIAVRLDGSRPISRRALQNALLGRARREGVEDAEAPQLTRYAWPHAIVRVHHHALAATRAWLPRIDFAVEGDQRVAITVTTLRSSGTIKTLTQRLGILTTRGQDKDTRARPAAGGLARARDGQEGRTREDVRPRDAPRRAAGTATGDRREAGMAAPPGRGPTRGGDPSTRRRPRSPAEGGPRSPGRKDS